MFDQWECSCLPKVFKSKTLRTRLGEGNSLCLYLKSQLLTVVSPATPSFRAPLAHVTPLCVLEMTLHVNMSPFPGET